MRRFLFVLVLLFCNIGLFSQSIIDFFENIPDSSMLNLTKSERVEIVKYSIDNKSADDAYADLSNNHSYAFDVVDVKNGYLRLIGAMEGHIQMCYWKLTNGNKLIAIYVEGCGPVCFVERFDFYEYDGKDYKPISAETIIPDIESLFYGDNMSEKVEEMNNDDIIATLLFELPQKGKNIIAKWGNEESQETYKNYGVGDRMILIWKDGKFSVGDIYWQ